MKKIAYAFLILACCIGIGSCTNDETEEKIEVITPVDSTKTVRVIIYLDE